MVARALTRTTLGVRLPPTSTLNETLRTAAAWPLLLWFVGTGDPNGICGSSFGKVRERCTGGTCLPPPPPLRKSALLRGVPLGEEKKVSLRIVPST